MKNQNQNQNKFRVFTRFSFDESGEALSEIELVHTGEWDSPTHGNFQISERTLDDMIYNFQTLRKEVAIDMSHFWKQGAAGWVKSLEKRLNESGGISLFAQVEWTDWGSQMITDRRFAFISPEIDFVHTDIETGREYYNVLVGAALTNRPFFKSLASIAASEMPSLTENQNSLLYVIADSESPITREKQMNLQEILAKQPEKLTADEKAFLKLHRAELTAEQKKQFSEVLEDNADEDADADADTDADADADNDAPGGDEDAESGGDQGTPPAGGVAGSEVVTLTASELKVLKEQARRGENAHKVLEHKSVVEQVDKLIASETNKSGPILPAQRDSVVSLLKSMTQSQRKQFSEIMSKQKAAIMFDEVGSSDASSANSQAKSADDELTERAQKIVASENISYEKAIDKVLLEDPDLGTRYVNESAQ